MFTQNASGQNNFDVPLITPEKAIEYALKANLDYLNLLDRTEMAQLDFAGARSVYKRKFRLYTSSDARSGAEVGTVSGFSLNKRNESGSAFSAGIYNSSFGDRSLSEFRLSYTLPFFRNPLDSSKLRIAQAEMNFSRRKRLQDIGTQELMNRVITSYLELILRNHMERLAASEYEISRNRYRAFQIRAQGGEVSDIDLARIELRMTQALQSLEMARFNRRSRENGFKILLGIDLMQVILIDTRIPENRHAHLLEIPLEELEAHAQQMRIELIGKREELSITEAKMNAASSSIFPPAEVSLQYAFVDESNSLSPASNFGGHRFGIGFRMDTDFGVSTKSREQRKNYLQSRTLQREYEQLKMNIRMEVRRAYFDSKQSLALMKLKTGSRQINEKVYAQVNILFENGQTDTLKVLEAEQQLEKSKYDELNARISYLQAGQALAMASGHFE